MNLIFSICFLIGVVVAVAVNPNIFMSAVTTGGKNAVNLAIKMLALYAFWLGFLNIMEKTRMSNKVSKALRPVIKFLFGELDELQEQFVTMNISSNILGLGNAATPMGINAIKSMKNGDTATYPMVMFLSSMRPAFSSFPPPSFPCAKRSARPLPPTSFCPA